MSLSRGAFAQEASRGGAPGGEQPPPSNQAPSSVEGPGANRGAVALAPASVANGGATSDGAANGATTNEAPPPWHPSQPLGVRVASARGAREGVSLGALPSEGTPVETGFAATLVARSPSEVALAIHDVNRYSEVIPQVVQSHELRRTPRLQDTFVRILVNPLPEMWARLRYRDEAGNDGAIEIDGRAIEGNLERMSLHWRLTPLDDGRSTLVELWALVVPNLPIPLPSGLLTREQLRTAQRGVTAVRARVESSDPAAVTAQSAVVARGARRTP